MTEQQFQANIAAFNRAWHTLAAWGACDGFGSAEYERVVTSWFRAGCPDDVADYIRRYANAPPGCRSCPD